MAYDSNNVRETNYDVTWNSVDLGGVDLVEPDFDLVLEPIKIGSAGRQKLDDRFVGLGDDAVVKVTVREVTLARIRAMLPWDDGAGAADLTPPVGTKLYQYAQLLVLHPRDQGAGTTQDIHIFKTVPISSMQLSRDGASPDEWEVTFAIYPDHTKLGSGVNPYGEVKGS